MYAIVKTGGKQYRVEAGQSVEVERLPAAEGDTIELGEVLLIAENGNVTVGTPLIEGARVLALVEQQGRAKKIIVLKYKSKVRTRKKTGHRQSFTRLTVEEILRPGEEAKTARPKPARVAAADAVEEEVVAAEVAEPVAAAPPEEVETPKRRIRRAAPKPEKTPAEAAAPKPRVRRAAPAAEKKPAKAERAAAKAEKPAAKAKAPAKGKAEATPEKKPARRLPLRRKKETE